MSKKKIASILITLSMTLGILAGCSSTQPTQKPAEQPAQQQPVQQPQVTEIKLFEGLGQIPAFRVGPGKDANEVQVYSFTYLTADAMFDKDGKILDLRFDALEISTPNYDGESMPHFSGWPGTPGYNVTDHASGAVTGISTNTNETIAGEVNGWKTKRERGDKYGMNYTNDWHKQADFYQMFFKGKTVTEIEAWFTKNCSDVNGRPLTAKSEKPEDVAKYAKLSDQEKKDLADVTSGATMSVKDAHGDFISAIKKAYDNRVEVTLSVK